VTQTWFFMSLGVGLVFGFVSAWALLRSDARYGFEKGKAEGDAEREGLLKQLEDMKARLTQVDAEVLKGGAEVTRLREEAKAWEAVGEELAHLRRRQYETSDQAEEIARLREGQAAWEADREALAALREQYAALEASRAEAAAAAEAETGREACPTEQKTGREASEALGVIQQTLAEMFQQLSSETLASSRQALLDLAGVTMERLQESARTDLDRRERAVDEMVHSVRDSLDKVASGAREISSRRLSADARAVTEAGKSLYGRLLVFAGQMARIRTELHCAMESCDHAVECLESEVIAGADRLAAQDDVPGQAQAAPSTEERFAWDLRALQDATAIEHGAAPAATVAPEQAAVEASVGRDPEL